MKGIRGRGFKLILTATALISALIALSGCNVNADGKIDIGLKKESSPIEKHKDIFISEGIITDEKIVDYRLWILSNYPQFEQENIDLQLRDDFQYGGIYIYPKTIIINKGDVEIGSNLLKQRVEHELTHYFLRMKYNDLDYNNHHQRIKDGEYIGEYILG